MQYGAAISSPNLPLRHKCGHRPTHPVWLWVVSPPRPPLAAGNVHAVVRYVPAYGGGIQINDPTGVIDPPALERCVRDHEGEGQFHGATVVIDSTTQIVR